MTATTGFLSRRERFDQVGSTNDIVRGWLADGIPEVCVAVADEQTAGRGRAGRTWVAPPGAAILLSLGFRPSWLDPALGWRLGAVVSLAMTDAAEARAGLPAGTIRLKWPNDLVIGEPGLGGAGGAVRKLGGVLGESSGLGDDDPTVIVGIGLNANWPPTAFPPELAASMTSLFEASGGEPVDRDTLLDGFVAGLEARLAALRSDRFDANEWSARQVTTGHAVQIQAPDGSVEVARAVGVDGRSGALVVDLDGATRDVFVGEIRHVRLATV